ncbi:MAG TPA: MFS transporter [Bryobacteraceae bacterium]|nr:MFS transporter [Bryobacteraceae bacterium]
MGNPWLDRAKLPRGPRAALAALHLAEPRPEELSRLSEAEWRQALNFCYRSRLVLPLGAAAQSHMPEWVRRQTEADARRNVERLARLRELYRGIRQRFASAGIPYLALKGIAQCPLFGAQPEERVQYDVDLFVPRERLKAAWRNLIDWGYEPLEGMEKFPTDHLPALIRKTGWEFRGDYFDPEIPFAVELHHQFWNERLERLPAPGVGRFWERRVERRIADLDLPVLAAADALGYAALHALKHVWLGSLGASHIYELACFLQLRSTDGAFWSEWQRLHAPELRRLEAVTLRLAREWFGCELAPAAREEAEGLPAPTQTWFREFAFSPAEQFFHSNKDELWLQLSLIDSRRDAWSVARRKLLPVSLPSAVDSVHVPASLMTWRRRALRRARWLLYCAGRAGHHAVALPRALSSGARWWLGRQFWTFVAAAVLFNLARFVFALLYNLHLLDLGFREDFLGVIGGAATVGTLAGTLPAAVLVRRIGLRGALIGVFAASAVLIPLRALVTARVPLVALAVIWGLVFGTWAVVMAPVIAGAVEAKRRPTAFSVFFATMFAVGIGGNWLGGRIPNWVHGKQPALLLAACLAALAIWPAWRLAPAAVEPGQTRIYPRSPFLARYLGPFALWNLGTASFNQFSNVYFARLRFPVERIGSIFSASQAVQVLTVLLAPLVFRRLGLVTGMVSMMAAAALGLGGLAAQPPGAAAALAYTAYMAFQWMSEPGLNTLLMNHVEERERGGASALNYLVAFSAQAVAAFGAGALLARFGYGPVLAGAAALAGVAAALFKMLIIS